MALQAARAGFKTPLWEGQKAANQMKMHVVHFYDAFLNTKSTFLKGKRTFYDEICSGAMMLAIMQVHVKREGGYGNGNENAKMMMEE